MKHSTVQMGLWILLLGGCALPPPKVSFPAGQALLKGETPNPSPPPDSLRAEMEMTVWNGRSKSTVSATLSTQPYRRYKLDLYGLPGVLGGSFLWDASAWTLVFYDRETYRSGVGDLVAFPNLGTGPLLVHDLFAFLWGDFFPGLTDFGTGREDTAKMPGVFTNASSGVFHYHAGGREWTVWLDSGTGVAKCALRNDPEGGDSAFQIVYDDYRLLQGRPVPGIVRVLSGERVLLEIKVREVEDYPKWRRTPFFIKVPESFRRETSEQ